ncbi:hypothetical protein QO010_001557 [Caulobacter ginsengisoli]|uniref:Uncharacterized protein n=1 Tax=Caulobacter ginsengisoli TaxID=400775 RepID=A0ABU0IR06_9CAUL|nr:hypothetical protein [Caulobacter ginsengisoli]MDQ0463786.1 hypothetical protein [Caulobacter ginsengisoli]
MYVWTQFRGQSCTPTPLLRHLAGDFAVRVGELWPAPHTPFLTSSTGQRHLIFIALTVETPYAAIRANLERPVKRAVRALLPDAPDGLVRALDRLGETAWSEADYRRLLVLLDRPDAAKVLNHAAAIDPDLVGGLTAFPAPLLEAGLARLKLSPDQAAIASEIWQAIVTRDGPQAGRRLAERMARLNGPTQLFEHLREEMVGEVAPPPFPGTARLRPLATKAAMREAAGRFNNCLRDHIGAAADGSRAYYEWLGPPGAVVEIMQDPVWGWRLDEARLRDNNVMTPADREPLIAELRGMGVHVGRSYWQLQRDTWGALQPGYRLEPPDAAIGAYFGE